MIKTLLSAILIALIVLTPSISTLTYHLASDSLIESTSVTIAPQLHLESSTLTYPLSFGIESRKNKIISGVRQMYWQCDESRDNMKGWRS